MLLEDFNYFINKAINQYINKRYNIYDINQQTTDDLRVLKAGTLLEVNPIKVNDNLLGNEFKDKNLFGATYEINLPSDYMHILNCICIYKMDQPWKCYDKDDIVKFAAKRLTADAWSIVINDYYNRPLPQRPYFYIHNINTRTENPTNPYFDESIFGTDVYRKYDVHIAGDEDVEKDPLLEKGKTVTGNSNFDRSIKDFKWPNTEESVNISKVNKETAIRYGNPGNVRMEIRCGEDASIFNLKKVWIDYIKTPQFIRLTQTQVNLTQDTSQIMEFPDYVCQEIINELVMLVMENTADPRLQTNTTVTRSIANPVQQQTKQG